MSENRILNALGRSLGLAIGGYSMGGPFQSVTSRREGVQQRTKEHYLTGRPDYICIGWKKRTEKPIPSATRPNPEGGRAFQGEEKAHFPSRHRTPTQTGVGRKP